ncbi:MAG: ABC transporter ATP-binding protein [Actinomycetaceae bacterium]|nr:ABC transporter ATP-binding protein [Actinomycetaceae bacterium]
MTLEILDLHKRFGKVVALDGMTFTVHPGELYGFVGSNGAGKTTTMRIALGVLETDSGEVRLNGTPLDFETRKNFGYMPAERGLYPKMRVGDQLIYLARLQGMSAADARQSMEYWTERLGVDARRGDEVQTLSLGNQQRVQLAAALIHNPNVLVLDEPFSGLDPVAVDVMSAVLREKAQAGATVVFSSHQLDLVERLCDRVGICARGKIVAEGMIDDLRTTDSAHIAIRTGGDSQTLANVMQTVGAQVLSVHANTVTVVVPAHLDSQAVLRAALDVGPVYEFSPQRPHLQDIFKDVVALPHEGVATTEIAKPKKKGLAALFGRK